MSLLLGGMLARLACRLQIITSLGTCSATYNECCQVQVRNNPGIHIARLHPHDQLKIHIVSFHCNSKLTGLSDTKAEAARV